jgi:hypothetical protein
MTILDSKGRPARAELEDEKFTKELLRIMDHHKVGPLLMAYYIKGQDVESVKTFAFLGPEHLRWADAAWQKLRLFVSEMVVKRDLKN